MDVDMKAKEVRDNIDMKVNHQFALGALSTYISSVKAVVAATGEGKFKVDMKAEAGKAITAASHTTAGKAITAAIDSLPSEVEEAVKKYA